MTRTDVMASSRPHTEGDVSRRSGSSGLLRRLSAISALLLLALAIALPATALATSDTAGYGAEPNAPAGTNGTSPSKESKSPTTSNTTSPTTSSAPTTETNANTLPFTGFDLRWSLAVGVLLMGSGFTIVAVQRRRRDSRR
jgi:preprotein translocase subunit SecG